MNKIAHRTSIYLFFLLPSIASLNAQNSESLKNKFVSNLMKKMTLDEKIGQLHQCSGGGDITGPNKERIPCIEQISQGFLSSMLNIQGIKDVHARIAITLTNTGKYTGEEVVQLYIRDEVASITRPIKELKGFEKIILKAGESKTVTFDLKDRQLGFYNNEMKFIVEKGDFTLMIGGNSEEVKEIAYNY